MEEPKLTGEVIGKTILNQLTKCNLSFNAAIAQGYDGASVMSSWNVGTSAVIKNICPFSDSYHCSAHALTVCLVHASKHPAMRNMFGVVKEITTFFSMSNKKQLILHNTISTIK